LTNIKKTLLFVINGDKYTHILKISLWMTIMVGNKLISDDVVLEDLGRRLARCRLDRGLTQAELAEQAGVSKRTVERMEAGASSQTLSLIRILRVLNLLSGLDNLVPETGPRPMDLLKLQGKERKRASSRKPAVRSPSGWSWDEDA
jgi:transcriptional regulator with XRE-family HTH domain